LRQKFIVGLVFLHTKKRKKYQDAYQLIKNQIGGIEPLDSDARQALENSLVTMGQLRSQLQKVQSYLNATQAWYQTQTRLDTQIHESQQSLATHTQNWLNLEPLRLKATQLDQIREIRPLIHQKNTLIERMTIRNQSLAKQKIQVQVLQEKLAHLQPNNVMQRFTYKSYNRNMPLHCQRS